MRSYVTKSLYEGVRMHAFFDTERDLSGVFVCIGARTLHASARMPPLTSLISPGRHPPRGSEEDLAMLAAAGTPEDTTIIDVSPKSVRPDPQKAEAVA